MSTMANLALEGGDPRNVEHPVTAATGEPIETQLLRAAHDSSVTFEEYVYWASITRAEEKIENRKHMAASGPKTFKSIIKNRFSNYKAPTTAIDSPRSDSIKETPTEDRSEKLMGSPTRTPGNLGGVSDSEYKNASRAIRTAGWSSVFYLITTDILGPFSTPYVQSSCMYIPRH